MAGGAATQLKQRCAVAAANTQWQSRGSGVAFSLGLRVLQHHTPNSQHVLQVSGCFCQQMACRARPCCWARHSCSSVSARFQLAQAMSSLLVPAGV